MFSPQDLLELRMRGLQASGIETQMARLQKGSPPLKILRPCKLDDGILKVTEGYLSECRHRWEEAKGKGRISKFIPASGAASRMFQALLHCVDHPLEHSDILNEMGKNLSRYPFFEPLQNILHQQDHDLNTLLHKQDFRTILQGLLFAPGLNYANLPKALLAFHRYPTKLRTALEEHIQEALQLIPDDEGKVRCHITVSQEHAEAVRDHLHSIQQTHASPGRVLDLTVSIQSPGTDTIALDSEKKIVRTNADTILFRPGGHGSLLKNLNDYQGDIIFISNIDNVVPDHLRPLVITWRTILGGHLLSLQQRVFSLLDCLAQSIDLDTTVREAESFVRQELKETCPPSFTQWPLSKRAAYFQRALNRPIRVCGMVPNTGDPGGGPFWVEDQKGTVSRQIVEQAQIDSTSAGQREVFAQSTHFNPVDMVCGVRDFLGNPFDLQNFLDPETAFVAQKSYMGRPITVLEWPGLWNGAMAFWLTIFVEIPREAFNPVKTYQDWLHPHHQPPA